METNKDKESTFCKTSFFNSNYQEETLDSCNKYDNTNTQKDANRTNIKKIGTYIEDFRLENNEGIKYCIIELSDNIVITSSSDNYIKLWKISTKECIKSIYCKSVVYSVIKLTNELIACGSQDSTIRILDINTEKCIKELPGYKKFIGV